MVGGNKIARSLPGELPLFSLLLLPYFWVCSDTSLSVRPLTNCRCRRLRRREVLHYVENPLLDLSSWKSSDVIFNRCFLVIKSSDSQLWASPNDLSDYLFRSLVPFHLNCTPIQNCNTTTERLGKRRARAGELIGRIVTVVIVVFPNKEAILFKSIRSQNGANKRQRFAIIVLFVSKITPF